MPSPASTPSADTAAAGKYPSGALISERVAANTRLRTALARYTDTPDSEAAAEELRGALLGTAELVSQLPRRTHPDSLSEIRAVLPQVCASGIHDLPAAPGVVSIANRLACQGWPGVLGATLLLPAWQWAEAPALDAVPDWMWGDYSGWLFSTPQGFCAVGQAEQYSRHVLERLKELTRWVDRNAGSATVFTALSAYFRRSSAIPLYFTQQSLREHAELRGRLLTRAFAKQVEAYSPFAEPRYGRKLRVGFINRHFGPQTETYTTLPTFEQLDPEQFDVHLFAFVTEGTPLEQHCRSRAKEFHVLPSQLPDQVALLRGLNLDVVVFGTNVTAVIHEVTLLALHRLAPLQVVNNSSCITSGLPEIDLYVSGTQTETPDAPAHFSERLALLPGPTHAFNYTADAQEPTIEWNREKLGIPADATVFVSAANYFKIIPEMQHTWARLLADTPGSYLLVHPFNPNWSSTYPIQRFCAEFDRVLREHGIDPGRLIVSSAKFPSRSDVKELLRLGNVYLDTYPFGGVNSLIDPLELGIPVVAWEGETFRSRMGAAILRSLDLPELIAADEAGYLAIAGRLASDPAHAVAIAGRISGGMERQPIFLDPLAASDAFGDVLTTAYDLLAENGPESFRSTRTPLQAAEMPAVMDPFHPAVSRAREALRRTPNDPAARHAVGLAYLEEGLAGRAVDYLLAAVQNAEANPRLWFDLAQALRQNSQFKEAIQALETCLRQDRTLLDGWFLLAELAQSAGAHDLAQDAISVARSLCPTDQRLAAYP